MPAARPRAAFEPIPPDFDVKTLVESVDKFQYVDRISYSAIAANGDDKFEKLVLLHVIIGGKPLVIDGFDEILDPWTFTPSWLRDNHGDKGMVKLWIDQTMMLSHLQLNRRAILPPRILSR